jgi:hypothetical protein
MNDMNAICAIQTRLYYIYYILVDKYSLFAIRDYFVLVLLLSWFLGWRCYDTDWSAISSSSHASSFGSGGGLFQRRFGPASPSLFSLKTKSFLSLVSSMLYLVLDGLHLCGFTLLVQFRFKPSGNSLVASTAFHGVRIDP